MKKKILIFLGVVLVVFGLLLVAPNLIDGNRFKPLVIEGFEAATGRQIIIDGDLSLKLIPSPALSVSNVSLANIPGGQAENFLELENLDLRLELFPLLGGKASEEIRPEQGTRAADGPTLRSIWREEKRRAISSRSFHFHD